jgi:DNA primase
VGDVAGLYRRFGVRLPDFRSGWASTRCFSGQHRDRHPSLRVNLETGGFRCFGCGARGGILDALELLGLSRDDARRMAIDYGVFEERRPPRTNARRQESDKQAGNGHEERQKPDARALARPAVEQGPVRQYVDYDNLAGGAEVRLDRTWTYTDEHGASVGRVRRQDLVGGGKRVWVERPDGDGWKTGLNGTQLPLYRLPEVLEHARNGDWVVVVEGEKACDGLDRLGGVFSTTCAGGSGKWRDDHTAALVGATVVAIADCDRPGREHAVHLTADLLRAGVTALMPIDLYPLRHDGSDIVDYFAELAATERAVLPDLPQHEVRARLRHHLAQLLAQPLPATLEALQDRLERDRYRLNPEGLAVLRCRFCERERVHRLSPYGLAFCGCGAHQAAPA